MQVANIERWFKPFSKLKGRFVRGISSIHQFITNMQSSIGRDTIIFYACTMEVWHFSSYFTIKNYVNDDIRPHPTQFSWPSSFVETFDTLKSAIEPRMTRLTHSKRHEKSRLHVNSYETSWMIEVTLTENLELKRMRICTLIHCTVSLASRTKTTIGQ